MHLCSSASVHQIISSAELVLVFNPEAIWYGDEAGLTAPGHRQIVVHWCWSFPPVTSHTQPDKVICRKNTVNATKQQKSTDGGGRGKWEEWMGWHEGCREQRCGKWLSGFFPTCWRGERGVSHCRQLPPSNTSDNGWLMMRERDRKQQKSPERKKDVTTGRMLPLPNAPAHSLFSASPLPSILSFPLPL